MKFHRLPAHGQAQARSRIFRTAMEPLEKTENLLEETRFNADTVVLNPKKPFSFALFRSHLYPKSKFVTKLQGVSYQILEKLS